MTITYTDFNRIQRNLAILMKNSVALSSKFYDLFVTATPMDVELRVWTSENEFQSILVPNRAKGNIPVRIGTGDPNDQDLDTNYGTIYIDNNTKTVYIKITDVGVPNGWVKLITSTDLVEHNRSNIAHQDVLAPVHGDEKNYFYVKDINLDDTDNDKWAVNKHSYNLLIGGIDNLTTTAKENLVKAINEVNELDKYDTGCVAKGSFRDSVTNNTIFLSEALTSSGVAVKLNADADTFLTTPAGKKINFKTDLTVSLASSVSDTNRFSIYVDCTDPLNLALIALPGEYYIGPYKPSFMVPGDAWLDVGATPNRLVVAEIVDDYYQLVEKEYVFVGIVEVKYE